MSDELLIKRSFDQAGADIAYLLNRACRAGHFSLSQARDFGASSNALVLFAYAGIEPTEWPRDRADYAACVRAVRKMPRHRRGPAVMEMLGKAKERYLAEGQTENFPPRCRCQQCGRFVGCGENWGPCSKCTELDVLTLFCKVCRTLTERN